MNLTLIINGIIALSKVIPYVKQLIDLLTEKWIDKKIEDIDAKRITRKHKRDALLNSIKAAKTNEERKALSIILADFDGMSNANGSKDS